jgi:hypothetical protein
MTIGNHNIHNQPQRRWTLSPCELTTQDLARFWAKVDRKGAEACWLWRGSVTGTGSVKHAQFTVTVAGKQHHIKAHRAAWELANGAIPDGLKVCHRCDVGHCCNPAHLFLGTQADNLNDARQKGRLIDGQGARKLSDAAYRRILSGRGRGVDLARRYGVTETTISRIRHGRQGTASLNRILQDQAPQPQPRLAGADVLHQVFEPVPSIQVAISGDVQ